jgi:hypothetical protein
MEQPNQTKETSKQHPFVTTGIPSLFLIFCVLCLVILALLALGTSRSDLRQSTLSMEQTTAYYDACNEASGYCLEIEEYLKNAYPADSEQDYFSSLSGISEEFADIEWNPDSRQITFCVSVADTQELFVELLVNYSPDEEIPCYQILTWETRTSGTWTPDMRQNLYTP